MADSPEGIQYADAISFYTSRHLHSGTIRNRFVDVDRSVAACGWTARPALPV
jgi:hypothetical protein